MQKRSMLLALASLPLLGEISPRLPASQTEVVTLAPVLVEDSKADAFCLRVQRGPIPKFWLVNIDGAPRWPKGPPPAAQADLHLVALRSFTLQSGDEIVRINGTPVTAMTREESLHALLGRTNPQPVPVEVRAPGTTRTRAASFVLQSAVRTGVRVPKPN